MPSWHTYGYIYLLPWLTFIKNTSLTISKIFHLLCSQELINYFQNLPLDPTLGQVNPAQSLNSSRFTLILSFHACHGKQKWSFSFKYSDRTIYHTCCKPTHLIRLHSFTPVTQFLCWEVNETADITLHSSLWFFSALP